MGGETATPPPGLLRALILFHQSASLGAGSSVLRTADELALRGWTLSGWLPGPGALATSARGSLASVQSAERPIAFSVRGWREQPGWRRRATSTPAYLRAVRGALLRTRPHIVHANTLLSLPEAAVARSCGLPVVLQVHEIPEPGAKRTVTVRTAARIADVLVAVSDAVADVLVPHAGRTPVLVVRNGIPPPAALRRVAAGRPFTVGTVGTVSRIKGTDVFLGACRRVLEEEPDIRFEHVGAPDLHRDPGLDSELAALLADPLVASAVTMLGQRPADDVLPGWDVVVSASRSEAFPLAVLEAMAAGLPVIATSVGGVPEQIEHLRTGVLVPPDDPAAIAAWILRLRCEPELRSRLGRAAAERVAVDFTLARQAEGLHRAYLSALDLRFGPPVVRARIYGAA